MSHIVRLVHADPQSTLEVHGEIDTAGIAEFLGMAFHDVAASAARQQLQISGPPFARWAPGSQGGWSVVTGFPVTGAPARDGRVEPGALPGGRQARTTHVGAYDEVAGAYQAITDWLAAHSLVAIGPGYESYLDDPDVPKPRTEVSVPCAPAPTTREGASHDD